MTAEGRLPPVVISPQELARIRTQTCESLGPTSQLSERLELKKLSDQRARRWPNTIEALRAAKVHSTVNAKRGRVLERSSICLRPACGGLLAGKSSATAARGGGGPAGEG